MSNFAYYIEHVLDSIQDSRVKEAMQYSLTAGGKRIRPRLLFATLQAYGIGEEEGYACGAAIEMIHTYSLIHDDLPAMDNDTLRRGKPTCHVKFDEATAILAGDALLTQAFVQATMSCEHPAINVAILRDIAQYSGADGMILGQIKDLEGEHNPSIDVAGLKDIHLYKTGKLLTLPLLCAARLANAKEQDLVTWQRIGELLGLSFQIQDDILDVTSTAAALGKNINSDADNEKSTYVSMMGIAEAQKEADRYYTEAKSLLHKLSIKEESLLQLFDELMKRKN